jgi:CRP/FNR family transcriptional regulator, cyclic AMP receptor protein
MRKMRTIETIIGEHPFFKDLAPSYLALLAGCASNARFNPNEFIFREGEVADQFYLIRYGKVSLDVYVPGRGPVTIQTINEDEVLGWSWLFPPYQWHFDARTLILTRAIVFDGQCLRTKCETDHELGYELMKRFAQIIVQRLQAARLQNLDLYGVP